MITYPISSNFCEKISLQCYQLYNFPSFRSSYWRSSVRTGVLRNFAKFTGKLLIDYFWSFSCLLLKNSCLFHFKFSKKKNEVEKGKYHGGVQMFTFLLEYRFVWSQRFQKKFDRWWFDHKMCLKGIWWCSFHG